MVRRGSLSDEVGAYDSAARPYDCPGVRFAAPISCGILSWEPARRVVAGRAGRGSATLAVRYPR